MAKTISQMIRATEANPTDLLMCSQVDQSSPETGYVSRAFTLSTVAAELLNGMEYETELETVSKKLIPAINELLEKVNTTNTLFAYLNREESREFHLNTTVETGSLRRVPFVAGVSAAGTAKVPVTVCSNSVSTSYTDMNVSGESVVNFQLKQGTDTNDWYIKVTNTGTSGVYVTMITGVYFTIL